ncbi:hypothetical protein SEA_AROOSTOOK_52 [Mycobacterium phage Aroostook]|nr:hypothetical protein SEA_CEDASITE_52 [Mycobacterium phage Cedasite]AOT25732.1 hypothetical protein SEA_ZOMBIE_51 [Mycobacterium phage Zombie]AOT28110.1 hypothetical protein SEA_JANE_52 [Mycobacterium phage Jane]ASZ72777.1 hypothetical protein SEA_AROOSTOOK_52 [Mycobacterium phage Aroostook]ASZ73142.1 hypothetical protein SEA_GIDEON_53 [Mycobacterium phage Gideon]ATN88060.1 hypothetical protein SEA_CHANCE64_52 [Mycobacterium phage Chance64]ATW60281.1 hypothetical protein SEA_LOUISV14_54 [My
MKCPSCGAYSLTYDRRLHAFICHIYGATIPAERIPA